MPRVAILTATKRPGLDVTFEGLLRQDFRDFTWIVADELFSQRMKLVMDHCLAADQPWIHLTPPSRPEGYFSNLPAIYNKMIEVAEEEGCEIAVSLQDYIWPPVDGIGRFVRVLEQMPNALVTGLCSMLSHPKSASVVDPAGLWTIFREPYRLDRWSSALEWSDVRGDAYDTIAGAIPIVWEMNWAAWPLDLGLRFDESWGQYIGNENQDFAWRAYLDHDCPTIIDPANHAFSLPHRHYWPEEWESQQVHRRENMDRFNNEYGSLQSLMLGEFR